MPQPVRLTTENFTSSSNSDSATTTVPASAKLAVLHWAGLSGNNNNLQSASLAGNSFLFPTNGQASVNDNGAMGVAYLDVSAIASGSQTLSWDWEGTSSHTNGAQFQITYYDNVNLTAPIIDSDATSQSFTSTSVTLTGGTANDLVSGGAGAWSPTVPNAAPAGSGQTQYTNNSNFNETGLNCAEEPGAASVTFSANVDYWGVAAVLIAGSVAGETTLDAEPGNFTWTGQDAALERSYSLTAEAGSFTWTGQDATLERSYTLSAEAGAFVWTGFDATLERAYSLTAEAGSFVWSGQDAEFLLDRILQADPGAYAWTGFDAELQLGASLPADPGAYAWAGQEVTFTRSFSLTAEPGAFAWVGEDAALTRSLVLDAEAGSYVWAGQDAALTRALVLDAESGAFAWVGEEATLQRDYVLEAESGAFVWTGFDAALLGPGETGLVAEAGSFDWTGEDVTFSRNYVLEADSGAFSWVGRQADLIYSAEPTEVPGGIPPIRRRRRRRYVLPNGESYDDPDRALFELRRYLAKQVKESPAEPDGRPAAQAETSQAPEALPSGALKVPRSIPQSKDVPAGLMAETVVVLPKLMEQAEVPRQSLDPQLLSVLFEKIEERRIIDDEEAMLLLL